ncbi:GtrA family protein [Oceaniglobus trochenteri]|uniref:GtrA family protein n=1 Tax=Oceaniglobus trochenteri TaxID=2763260 RepID=UPI001CFFFD1E|nr:GtrA family protein [Oceaniglobus trochenteri]
MRVNTQGLVGQVLRFGVVGVANTVMGVGATMAAFHLLGWGPLPANGAGYAAGFVFSYVMHRFFTFRSAAPAARSLPRYAMVLGTGYLANLVVLYALLGLEVAFLWAQIAAMVTFSALVFAGSRAFAFSDAR